MIKSLCVVVLLAFPVGLWADDIEFFENKYGVKLPGVKPKDEYGDPDAYYTAIARLLGIPQLASKAAAGKFGWKEDDKKIEKAIVRRGSKSDHWEIMIFRFAVNPETRKPEIASMEAFMIMIDDEKKARSVERYDEAMKKARKKRPVEKGKAEEPAQEDKHAPASGQGKV